MMKKVLIVDDEYQFGRSLKSLLAFCDIEAIYHYDAYEAMQCLEKEECDIALINIEMSQLDGALFAHLLCKTHPDLKALLLTDGCQVENQADIQFAGVRGLLHKPVDINTVVRAIRQLRREEEEGARPAFDIASEQRHSLVCAG